MASQIANCTRSLRQISAGMSRVSIGCSSKTWRRPDLAQPSCKKAAKHTTGGPRSKKGSERESLNRIRTRASLTWISNCSSCRNCTPCRHSSGNSCRSSCTLADPRQTQSRKSSPREPRREFSHTFSYGLISALVIVSASEKRTRRFLISDL